MHDLGMILLEKDEWEAGIYPSSNRSMFPHWGDARLVMIPQLVAWCLPILLSMQQTDQTDQGDAAGNRASSWNQFDASRLPVRTSPSSGSRHQVHDKYCTSPSANVRHTYLSKYTIYYRNRRFPLRVGNWQALLGHTLITNTTVYLNSMVLAARATRIVIDQPVEADTREYMVLPIL